MSKKKSNRKSKGQQELNPLVTIGILGVVLAGAGYFVFGSSDTSDSSFGDSSFTSSKPTKTIIENVEAPDAKNAPIILPEKVTDLAVFHNEVSNKQHDVFDAKLNAELAQTLLTVQKINDKSQELKAIVNSKEQAAAMYANYGVQNGAPASNYNSDLSTSSDEQQGYGKNANSVVSKFKDNHSVEVSMTTVINGKRLAVVKEHDKYKTVGVNNYVTSNMKVKSITEHSVCFSIIGKGTSKTTCIAV
ncbi:hypothetical protein [Photobacterium damselae]|uniref:hypothetical protein n=1 Tax=Photobacterium damselae TaxID=38293 RepID=UPI0040698B46